jgi:hypothetical protein
MSRNSCPHLNNLVHIVPAELCQQKKVKKKHKLHGIYMEEEIFNDCITALARIKTRLEREREKKFKNKKKELCLFHSNLYQLNY